MSILKNKIDKNLAADIMSVVDEIACENADNITANVHAYLDAINATKECYAFAGAYIASLV